MVSYYFLEVLKKMIILFILPLHYNDIDYPFIDSKIHQNSYVNFISFQTSPDSTAVNKDYQIDAEDLKSHIRKIEFYSRKNNVFLSIFIYLIVYYLHFNFLAKNRRSQKDRPRSSLEESILDKKEASTHQNINAETINEFTEKIILEGLKKFENKYSFLQKSITLGKLATELNTNVRYLSIVIKKHKAENFNQYLNGLRIQYIVVKLKYDEEFSKYKISYLSDLCGYSSPAAFTRYFFEIMRQTPSEYIKDISHD
ncbi:hypothetical protein SDC9_01421 [bioreactor metagenome]|jgi:AraC-like DNA-binding protein|uniref:HTH araC/xylS-type domain-containing protein n=1 Tax=bioreactor metagenome TaxID=1076179 RepID=A0A644SMR0_9ZZZZ